MQNGLIWLLDISITNLCPHSPPQVRLILTTFVTPYQHVPENFIRFKSIGCSPTPNLIVRVSSVHGLVPGPNCWLVKAEVRQFSLQDKTFSFMNRCYTINNDASVQCCCRGGWWDRWAGRTPRRCEREWGKRWRVKVLFKPVRDFIQLKKRRRSPAWINHRPGLLRVNSWWIKMNQWYIKKNFLGGSQWQTLL